MNCKKMIGIKDKAFTLVELIVVIVILAILATIAFLSFSSQSASARDSTRLSDMSNIAKGLLVFNATSGNYPLPDNKVTISSGTLIVGYQGDVGDSVLRVIRFSGSGKDPISISPYTFSTNINKTRYQILGFLENRDSIVLDMNPFDSQQLSAITYTDRYPYQRGDMLGIILYQTGSKQTPLQDMGAGIDLLSGVSGYVAIIDNSDTATGVNLEIAKNYTATGVTAKVINGSCGSANGQSFSGTPANNLCNGGNVISFSGTGPWAWSCSGINGGTTGTGCNASYSPYWTVAGGGDCLAVNNAVGSNGNTSTCIDNRIYAHAAPGATHDKTYSLLKIEGKWYFNENLGYPLPDSSKYAGAAAWSGADIGLYSCPGSTSGSNTPNCGVVNNYGYLYQFKAAVGIAGNTDDSNQYQGICPSAWHIPKRSDFISAPGGYWPNTNNSGVGTPTGFNKGTYGYRIGAGTYSEVGGGGALWTSFDKAGWDGAVAVKLSFDSSIVVVADNWKYYGYAVRCIKD